MTSLIKQTISSSLTTRNKPFYVSFLTAGYPSVEYSVNYLVALQDSDVDVIELGMPFTDPLADGKTIQYASEVALNESKVNMDTIFEIVKLSRSKGLVKPILLMGYLNPILKFGEANMIEKSLEVGVQGYIIVDLPFDTSNSKFIELCQAKSLCFIPLLTPASSVDRIDQVLDFCPAFIYLTSRLGVTGAQDNLDDSKLKLVTARIRDRMKTKNIYIPLATGFGVSNNDQFQQIAKVSEGVVIGSKIINIIKENLPSEKNNGKDNSVEAVKKFCSEVVKGAQRIQLDVEYYSSNRSLLAQTPKNKSFFGEFGGTYAPEALIQCLKDLDKAFLECKKDERFKEEFESFYPFISRPSKLQYAKRLTEYCKGAKIYLKREDLNHTGSHKINNALGQVLLARKIGKTRIIAETGAGQHGVATATVCAHFGMKCYVYMGLEDMRRQALNVFRIRLLGAEVIPVTCGSKTLKDAVNEAMRDWVTNVNDTHYVVGSAIGPHPFPTIVRDFQSVIGIESRKQMLELTNKLPDAIFACVGGGSNSIGMFHPFCEDKEVEFYGVEAGGEGIDSGKHSAALSRGTIGVFHGTKTYVLQTEEGQITETFSISAGLDYPGVGPEHAFLKDTMRANYIAVNDEHALLGLKDMTQLEGILPALESAHCIYAAMEHAKNETEDKSVLICLSGRGDKDVHSIKDALPRLGPKIGWDLRFEEFN